ncbi:response regulator [Actinomadura scrupuli]|uniref:response regulator transcription factor n=1 Tax=Actinomadura scrupuli TaxID=559629 RepID=UPI003D999091
MSGIRVIVADDNPVVRSGLVAILEASGEVEVLGEVGDGRSAIELAERARPDVVLLDVRMPLVDGVTAAESLSKLSRVLMLTYTDDADVIRSAVRNGAAGYLVHGTFTGAELLAAVRDIARGTGNPLSAVAVSALMEAVQAPSEVRRGPAAPGQVRFRLSAREAEVMDLISQGRSNREIATVLFVSEKTVKNHVNRIFAKLLVANRAAAIALWLGTAVEGP